MSKLFYNLGKKAGPYVRRTKWVWKSVTGSETDAIQLERDVGHDMALKIRGQLDPDPAAVQLLSEVGAKLSHCVANKLRTFSFEPIKNSEPNAFALPGGFIFVTHSLVELCEWNKDEIAFILAHEMSHVIRGHVMERIISSSAINAGSRVAPIRGLITGWLRTVGIKFLESAYSQEMELEADKLAARLIVAAGYEPQAPMRLLTRLSQRNRPEEQFNIGKYFSSHPEFKIRIDNVKSLSK
ncbi:MAG: M48 family metallopeptidase [Planctomycetota bacterium]